MYIHPHYNTNVKDETSVDLISTETLPLHRPLHVQPTERGPVGVPVWCQTLAEEIGRAHV